MNNKAIMVVDDDQDLRESLVEILEGHNFTVIPSATAEEALQEIRKQIPDLAIIDYMMPGMGGMALITRLKNDYPSLKIIMITAFSTVDNAVNAMKSGADDYLAKPFKREELLVTIRRNLEASKFENESNPDMDEALACLSNPIRRKILTTLYRKKEMRFMDITRHLGIADHTKVNFHLRNLKNANLITQNREKVYALTQQGEKVITCLRVLSVNISP